MPAPVRLSPATRSRVSPFSTPRGCTPPQRKQGLALPQKESRCRFQGGGPACLPRLPDSPPTPFTLTAASSSSSSATLRGGGGAAAEGAAGTPEAAAAPGLAGSAGGASAPSSLA